MVKGRARTILWHEQGPEEAVYEPGPSSLAFTTVDFGRGKDDTNVIAWILKLCVLQNDAMVRSGGELGSGFYFFSIAAEAFGLGRPTADEMQAYGPALVWQS